MFVVEAKAAPLGVPFRDTEKAFTRLRRDFRADGGVQKSYDQANRIRRAVLNGGAVSLYDGKGVLLRQISRVDIDEVFCICVTADDYGALATDLSLLLEKTSDEAYPWAVNVFDLQALVAAAE